MRTTEHYQHLGVSPQGRLATRDNAYAAKERSGLATKVIATAFRPLDDMATPELRKRLARQ